MLPAAASLITATASMPPVLNTLAVRGTVMSLSVMFFVGIVQLSVILFSALLEVAVRSAIGWGALFNSMISIE